MPGAGPPHPSKGQLQERLVRALYERAPVGIGVLDSWTGRFLSVNPRYCEITGYSEAELLERDVASITHPDDLAADLANMERLRAREAAFFRLRKRYVRRDGSVVWVALTAAPLWLESEPPDRHVAIVDDVTAMVAADEAVRRSEERLRLALAGTNDGTWDWDLRTRKTFLSPRWRQILGYGEDDLPDHEASFFGLIHPEDRPRVEQALANHLSAHEPYDVEVRLRARDGSWRWVRTRGEALFDDDGRAFRMVGAATDIHARMEQQEALARERATLQAVFDHMPSMVFLKDLEGRYVFVNRALACQPGLAAERWRGSSDAELFPPELAQRYRASDAAALERQGPWMDEDQSDFGGVLRDVLTVKFPVLDPAGKTFAIGGIATDVTELRRAERALAESEQRFRLVYENSPMGMAFVSAEGVLTDCNPALPSILGTAREALLGKDVRRRLEDADMRGAVEQAFAGEVGVFEGRYRSVSGGKATWMRATWVPLRAGAAGCGGVFLIAEDITAQHQTEQALRDSEERFRRTLSKSPVVVFTHDRELRYTWLHNPAGGLQVADVVGRTDAELLPAEQAARLMALKRRVLEEGLPLVEEVEIEPGGVRGTFTLTLEPLRDERGTVTGVSGVAVDVTERRRAEQALRLHAGALAATANGVMLCERDGTISWVNQAFCRLTGYEAPDLLGRTPRVLKSGLHDLEHYQRLWATILAGDTWTGEVTNRCADGSLVEVEQTITPLRDEHGRVTHFVAVHQDVGWRNEAARRLRESEQRFRGLVHSLDAIVWEADPVTGQLTFVSDPAERLLGFPLPWWTADPGFWALQVHADDRAEALAGRARLIESGACQMDYRMLGADGQEVWLHEVARAERDPDGRTVRLAGVAVDVTRARQLEQAIARAQGLAELGGLLAGFAHEVRNPLFAISVTLDALTAALEDRPDLSDLLEAMGQERQRMTRLTEDLLFYGRPTTPTQPARLDLILDLAIAVRREQLGKARVGVARSSPSAAAEVRADPDRLVEAVANLIDNACHHAPHGTDIEVGWTLEEDGGGRWARVTVADRGPGFEPDALPHVFEPFFTRRRGGTGLGLAIVRKIVEEHGGYVEAANRPEGGAVVRIDLPLLEDEGLLRLV